MGNKWVFKVKTFADGSNDQLKARLLALGYTMREGIDYNNLFATLVKLVTLRIILALAPKEDLELHDMDIPTASLNGVMEEGVYMQQPEGKANVGEEHLVCRLNKALYGTKQAAKPWCKQIDATPHDWITIELSLTTACMCEGREVTTQELQSTSVTFP